MNQNGRTLGSVWSALLFAALLSTAGCSTQVVRLQATAGEGMNPNRAGGSGVLEVYAFFLKKPDAFAAKDKLLADFLTKSVRDGQKPPPFLEQDTVAVEKIEIAPAEAGSPGVVTKKIEVAVEATCVGLVAAFQMHRDNDDQVVWRLVVPVQSGVCAFQVVGKRLELLAPKKKEAPRAEPSDG